ncbi:hypothetical protein [Paenibacillus caui]|uniref:hypothetical protein n=1 Tax=Paenibacillus caui TaxID=2873927 RepID=UPI001CA879EA|nr:hypothetical protein [Paenibacillus caui]
MNTSKRLGYVAVSLAGVILLILGGFVLTSDAYKMVSGLCIGLGSAMTVLGIGNLLSTLVRGRPKDEEFQRVKAIEVNDERNVRIREKTGYSVSKTMNYLICVLVLTLGFMKADRLVILMVASLLVAELVLVIAFSKYYSKKI